MQGRSHNLGSFVSCPSQRLELFIKEGPAQHCPSQPAPFSTLCLEGSPPPAPKREDLFQHMVPISHLLPGSIGRLECSRVRRQPNLTFTPKPGLKLTMAFLPLDPWPQDWTGFLHKTHSSLSSSPDVLQPLPSWKKSWLPPLVDEVTHLQVHPLHL